jgi:5-methylcytosine-specific restriction enzyme A
MAWATSDRKDRLPPDWGKRRHQVLARCGGRCEVLKKDGSRCRDDATEVDHIVAGDSHELSNLRGICRWHHARKSALEGVAAKKALNEILYRKPETHPGVIPESQRKPTPNRGF